MGKIFLTGATGYIGGSVLSLLVKACPQHTISVLVRDDSKAKQVKEAFDQISIVKGELDSLEILEKAALDADVVLHLAATGHIDSTRALIKGLSSRSGSSPGYFIQISGASLLCQQEIKDKDFGKSTENVYDDVSNTEEITKIIKAFPNRVVDNFVPFVSADSVKTALIVGPLIYGKGFGPSNVRSVQVPEIARVTLETGTGFQIGQGLSQWSNVHVADIADLILKLVQDATSAEPSKATWNEDGIYFAENGEETFGAIGNSVARAAYEQKFIRKAEVKPVDPEIGDSLIPHGSVLLATNARTRATKARTLLGWHPSGQALNDYISAAVREEALRLGKNKI